MYTSVKNELINEIESIKSEGLFKSERIITSNQDSKINTLETKDVLNFCRSKVNNLWPKEVKEYFQ